MNSLRTFYRLAAPFWRSGGQWLGWLMLASIIGMGLLIVQINVLINAWSKTFYDTLGEFDTQALYALMGRYVVYLAAYVLIVVTLDWVRKALVLRWRQAMTDRFIQAWLADQAFYRLGLAGEPDNPDQRISEDINSFTAQSLYFLMIVLGTTATALAQPPGSDDDQHHAGNCEELRKINVHRPAVYQPTKYDGCPYTHDCADYRGRRATICLDI